MTARGRIVRCDTQFVTPSDPSFRASLGGVWENQGTANVLAIVKDSNLVQRVLELNSNNTRMIPDKYRATSIEYIIGLRDMLSW